MIADTFLKYKTQTEGSNTTASQSIIIDENYKVIATILYYLFMKVLNHELIGYERAKDKRGNDFFSAKLLPYKDVALFFKSKDRE